MGRITFRTVSSLAVPLPLALIMNPISVNGITTTHLCGSLSENARIGFLLALVTDLCRIYIAYISENSPIKLSHKLKYLARRSFSARSKLEGTQTGPRFVYIITDPTINCQLMQTSDEHLIGQVSLT